MNTIKTNRMITITCVELVKKEKKKEKKNFSSKKNIRSIFRYYSNYIGNFQLKLFKIVTF